MGVFFKYYYDLTKYNLLTCLLALLLVQRIYIAIAGLGTFGMLASVMLYRYYHNRQYYFYRNAGLSKKHLLLKSWLINLSVSIILLCIIRWK